MTLTETAYYTRNVIKYAAILLAAAILLRFTWLGIHNIYRHFFPAAPPPPEVKFKKLPAIPFTPKAGLPSNFTFSLQTPTGQLPEFPLQANVYFIPAQQTSFANLDEAAKTAAKLGFSATGTPLSAVIYRFTHEKVPATVDINIVNKTLSISYNLTADTRLLTLRPRSVEEVKQTATSFLRQAGLLVRDLDNGKQTVEFLKSAPENLEPVASISEANFVRVDFWRQDYDNLSVVGPKKDRSTVWLLVSGETYGPSQIIAGEYHYFPVAGEQKSTYPLKTAQEAWADVTDGKGLVISATPNTNQIVIRRIYLAYYDSGTVQQYLQPVVVFDGDADFRAIVPAVTTEYYNGN